MYVKDRPGVSYRGTEPWSYPSDHGARRAMSSGLSNTGKAKHRKAFARGEIDRQALLQVEAQSHALVPAPFLAQPIQIRCSWKSWVHLPGAAFEHPHSDLRHALNVETGRRAVAISRGSDTPTDWPHARGP